MKFRNLLCQFFLTSAMITSVVQAGPISEIEEKTDLTDVSRIQEDQSPHRFWWSENKLRRVSFDTSPLTPMTKAFFPLDDDRTINDFWAMLLHVDAVYDGDIEKLVGIYKLTDADVLAYNTFLRIYSEDMTLELYSKYLECHDIYDKEEVSALYQDRGSNIEFLIKKVTEPQRIAKREFRARQAQRMREIKIEQENTKKPKSRRATPTRRVQAKESDSSKSLKSHNPINASMAPLQLVENLISVEHDLTSTGGTSSNLPVKEASKQKIKDVEKARNSKFTDTPVAQLQLVESPLSVDYDLTGTIGVSSNRPVNEVSEQKITFTRNDSSKVDQSLKDQEKEKNSSKTYSRTTIFSLISTGFIKLYTNIKNTILNIFNN